jgi:hypothetical protein
MKTEIVPIGTVKANPNNPRIIQDGKFDKLVESIREFPEMLKLRPIVVNADGIVLTGPMAVWAYLIAFHAAVHRFARVYYDDGRSGSVLIAAHG